MRLTPMIALTLALSSAVARAQAPCEGDCDDAPPAPAVVARPAHKLPSHFVGHLALSTVYRYLLGEAFGGEQLDIELGVANFHDTFSVGFRFGLLAGASKVGLPFEAPSVGMAFTARLSERLRFAFGPESAFMIVHHASRGGEDQWSPSVGLFLEPTVDLTRRLFLVGRVAFDGLVTNGDPGEGSSFTASLGVGLHF